MGNRSESSIVDWKEFQEKLEKRMANKINNEIKILQTEETKDPSYWKPHWGEVHGKKIHA